MPTQPPGEPSIALFVILPGSRCCYGYASMILSTAKKVFFSFFACQISAASCNRDLRMLVAIFNARRFFPNSSISSFSRSKLDKNVFEHRRNRLVR